MAAIAPTVRELALPWCRSNQPYLNEACAEPKACWECEGGVWGADENGAHGVEDPTHSRPASRRRRSGGTYRADLRSSRPVSPRAGSDHRRSRATTPLTSPTFYDVNHGRCGALIERRLLRDGSRPPSGLAVRDRRSDLAAAGAAALDRAGGKGSQVASFPNPVRRGAGLRRLESHHSELSPHRKIPGRLGAAGMGSGEQGSAVQQPEPVGEPAAERLHS